MSNWPLDVIHLENLNCIHIINGLQTIRDLFRLTSAAEKLFKIVFKHGARCRLCKQFKRLILSSISCLLLWSVSLDSYILPPQEVPLKLRQPLQVDLGLRCKTINRIMLIDIVLILILHEQIILNCKFYAEVIMAFSSNSFSGICVNNQVSWLNISLIWTGFHEFLSIGKSLSFIAEDFLVWSVILLFGVDQELVSKCFSKKWAEIVLGLLDDVIEDWRLSFGSQVKFEEPQVSIALFEFDFVFAVLHKLRQFDYFGNWFWWWLLQRQLCICLVRSFVYQLG